MIRRAWIGLVIALVGVGVTPGHAEDPPALGLTDLAAYRAALQPGTDHTQAPMVTFRDLWEHPERHQGQPVVVIGRLARVFRQAAVGQFPPLAEAWITSPRGEPFCVVFPAASGTTVPALGSEVRFAGTFLRRMAYQGGDAERIAPLVVGPSAPQVDPAAGATDSGRGPLLGGDRAGDWLIGLAAAVGATLMIARRHLSRPLPAPEPPGPAPSFVDGPVPVALTFDDEGGSHGDA